MHAYFLENCFCAEMFSSHRSESICKTRLGGCWCHIFVLKQFCRCLVIRNFGAKLCVHSGRKCVSHGLSLYVHWCILWLHTGYRVVVSTDEKEEYASSYFPIWIEQVKYYVIDLESRADAAVFYYHFRVWCTIVYKICRADIYLLCYFPLCFW